MRTVRFNATDSVQAKNRKKRMPSLAGAIGTICSLLLGASSALTSVSNAQDNLSATDIIDPNARVRAVFFGGDEKAGISSFLERISKTKQNTMWKTDKTKLSRR